jgi:hypothetical protein
MTNGSYNKPQPDVYTLMLLLSLLAIIVATVFLYLETMDYGSPPYRGGPAVSVIQEGPALVLQGPYVDQPGGYMALRDGSIHA